MEVNNGDCKMEVDVEYPDEEEEFINIDELTVAVDMLMADHFEELATLSNAPPQVNADKPNEPVGPDDEFYSHWDYKQIACEIDDLPDQDVDSRNAAVRAIIRAINTIDQQNYWFEMCEPNVANPVKIAQKVLGEPSDNR
ncbi:hypothetical protein FRC07_003775, partial [Ceratobasidium sp. 392]